MRTRIGWLALLLTAGVALAPTNMRGQEIPRPDPAWPVPLGDPGRSGFYTAAEFVFFRQTNPLKSQIIAIRGLLDFDGSITADLFGQEVFPIGSPPVILPATAMPGSFIGSGNVALNAEQAAGPQTYQPGFRLTAGWRFEDRSAIEFSWMSLTEAKFSAVASIVPANLNPGPNLADSFLFAPVFNFPNDFAGPPNKVGLGNPLAAFGIWNAANTMSISFTQRYSQYDITGRIPVFETDYCRCYGLIGPRYVSMWESFNWRTVSQDFAGAGGQDDVAIYHNTVSNQLYGVDAGIGSEWFLGHGFAATLEGRAAAMIDFVHKIAKYERGDFAIGHKRAGRDYKAVPEGEARVAVYWYPIEGVEIRVGFDIMGFLNTVSSPHPVVFNYGSLDPTYQQTSRLLDGFFAGIGFIF